MDDINKTLLEKLLPYEQKIEQLENSLRAKDLEIVTLKYAVKNLEQIVEELCTKGKYNV